ncbi:MAG: hypothetical protein UY05_C0031G0008 [Candidatus Peregrinibacteria bacterium GW2011_GWA2_47_7]|nr:MAG: hypothetical protein UY05_C0031G0008 [Candidatus Peregrinibacteria bacterium GW2011_GWA2_47_7]
MTSLLTGLTNSGVLGFEDDDGDGCGLVDPRVQGEHVFQNPDESLSVVPWFPEVTTTRLSPEEVRRLDPRLFGGSARCDETGLWTIYSGLWVDGSAEKRTWRYDGSGDRTIPAGEAEAYILALGERVRRAMVKRMD